MGLTTDISSISRLCEAHVANTVFSEKKDFTWDNYLISLMVGKRTAVLHLFNKVKEQ